MSEEKIKFANIPVADREQMLRDNCYSEEKQDVKRHYTESELDEYRQYCVGYMIDTDKEEDAMDEIVAPFKARIKDLKAKSKEQFVKIKKGYEVVEKQLFAFQDEKSGTMCYYDELGVFDHSRRLQPNERQTKVFNINQSKTA